MAITKVTRTLLSTGIDDQSNATAITIDSSENVGIGTTSPTGKLGIYGGGINDIPLVITHAWGSSSTALISASNASSEVFKVERSGNVGIGTTSPDYLLEVETTSSSVAPKLGFRNTQAGVQIGMPANTNALALYTGDNERMRIDSSGNLNLNTTGQTDAKFCVNNAAGQYGIKVNDNASNGALIKFTTGATEVGSIAAKDGDIVLGTGDTGLRFLDGSDAITPHNISTNAGRDNAIDLGTTGARFKDIHLRGGVYADLVRGYADTDTYVNFAGSNVLGFITGASERMRINADGGLLVGATSINTAISQDHLIAGESISAGRGAVTVWNTQGTANCPVLSVASRDESNNSTIRFIQFFNNVTGSTQNEMGGIVGNGNNAVAFATISDEREKENITPVNNVLDKLMNLNVVSFDWKKSDDHVKAGFIAQNVEEYFPEYVVENMSSEGEEPRKGTTGGMSAGYIAVLTKAIQEQQTIIDDLKTRIETLESA